MEITVSRSVFTDQSTIGDLLVNEVWQCYTLEDFYRGNGPKVPGETAIPRGRYEVVITFSDRFQKPLPLLLNVPHFEGVRIHPGNTDKNTEGCILVGLTKADNYIGDSRRAFTLLFNKITEAAKLEKIWLEIVHSQQGETV